MTEKMKTNILSKLIGITFFLFGLFVGSTTEKILMMLDITSYTIYLTAVLAIATLLATILYIYSNERVK